MTAAIVRGDADIIQRRRVEPFVIVDSAARVVASSPGTDLDAFERHLPELVARHCARTSAETFATVLPFGDGAVLRIVDLVGGFGTVFVVTRERTESRRDPAAAIAVEHGLTSREREVLAMLLEGSSNSAISERLFIAQTTARDHTKNILRKTGSGKRSALLAKAIAYDRRRDVSKDA